MKILLVGGGGHCLACIDAIESEGMHTIDGIVERDGSDASEAWGYPVVGTDSDLPALLERSEAALVAIGQLSAAAIRRSIYGAIQAAHVASPVIVARSADVSARAKVGRGTVILAGARVNAGAAVGENCIINSQSLIEHGAVIGSDSHISTGARVNGDAVVGPGCFIGSGAIIREGVSLGAECVIGAGALVGADVPAGARLRAKWDTSG